MQIGLGIGTTFRQRWNPLLTEQIRSLLFSASEQGAWYDLSDISTLFQDSAGTVPVTAVEQPVGRMLDKSGRGNHATQATTTKRPVLSRRVNGLTESEFRNGVTDAPTRGGLVTGTTMAGYLGALAFGHDGVTSSYAYKYFTNVLDVPYTISVVVEMTDGLPPVFVGGSTPAGAENTFALVLGNVPVAMANHIVRELGDGRYRVTGTAVGTGGTNCGVVKYNTNSSRTFKVTAYDLRLATDANLPYQRVNTTSDYDAGPDKFPAYRRADGVDDSLASSTGGGGTTGFFFSAAISPLGSAGTNRTLFSDAGTNTGYIVRLNTGNQLELAAGNGTAYTTIATTSTLVVGASNVVQAWDDGTNLNVKIDTGPTASIARPVVSAGTAGYTLYQDNGASTRYFNGRSYGEIYRKDSGLTQSQREAVAVYQRQKARIA